MLRAHATWLIDWMANLIQCPQHKPGTAIVLQSAEEGTGKSLIVHSLLGKILRRDSLPSEQITGRFNGHMKSLVLLGC